MNEVLSATVSSSHRTAGESLAASYLVQLAKTDPCTESALSFPTLESLARTFRRESAAAVFAAAAARGVHNIKVRHEHVVHSARFAVKSALKSDAALARRLIAIREAQVRADRIHAENEAAAHGNSAESHALIAALVANSD